MAWVSVIGPSMEQVDYRLQEGGGCGEALESDGHAHGPTETAAAQITYRLADERGLMWIGSGLREVGLTPYTRLTPEQHDAARALMSGADPSTGKVLVQPKVATDPRAKLPAVPLWWALSEAAAGQGTGVADLLAPYPEAAKRAARLGRGIGRQGEAHLIPIADAEQLAHYAGVDLATVYPADELALANRWREAKVRVGNRGYDLTLDVTKSFSALYGLAGERFAAALETAFADAVAETVAAVETWAAYGMRGHHGDGQHAERVQSSGLLGWVMWHGTARPVDGQAPDPHLHAHVSIANLVKGEDGKWSTIGAGGRDLHRHAHAADAFLKARLRRVLTQAHGIAWGRDPGTGAWEIVGIPEPVRALLSKRSSQVCRVLDALGVDYASASRKTRKVASAESRQAATGEVPEADLRAEWQRQLREAGFDGADMAAQVERAGQDGQDGAAALPQRPTLAEIAAWVWRTEEGGLTAHTKVVTRADVLAAVMDALPDGVTDLQEADFLTDAVLALDPAVLLPDTGARHLSNNQRYTSQNILQAEQTLLEVCRARYDAGVAVVDADAARLALDAYQVSHHLNFSAEQRQVLERVLTGGHGVEAVIGVAGAGKTTLMAAARTAWESRGLVVAGAANAAVAAINLHAEAGIEAATVASWLLRIHNGNGLAGVDVLVLDEAAMIDDRQMAALLSESMRTGTKVVLIGDPLQLRAAGVGGGFSSIHHQVAGLHLQENRRQRDPIERQALALWRQAGTTEQPPEREQLRRQALATWAQGQRVAVGRGAEDTMGRLLADWVAARQPYQGAITPDAQAEALHDELAQVLVLAGSNAAADRLNHAARAIRRELGELEGPDHVYQLPGGRTLALAVGDHIRVRVNDYRAWRSAGKDVFNGYRGRISAIATDRRVEVEWRQPGPDGPHLTRQWLTPDYIAEGGISHGSAMTVAAAQGLNANHALIYGPGLDPHTLYAAMTRDRDTARLYLPLELLETDADRAALGQVRDETHALQRAMTAFLATLDNGRSDQLLTAEPTPIAEQASQKPAPAPGQRDRDRPRLWTRLDRSAEAPRYERHIKREGEHHDPATQRDKVADKFAALQRATALLHLSQIPYRAGLLPDDQLAVHQAALAEQASTAAAALRDAESAARHYATEGGGPAEQALADKRAKLAAHMEQIRQAAAAIDQLHHAREQIHAAQAHLEQIQRDEQEITAELAGLGTILPRQRARRRHLENELPSLREQQQALIEHLTAARQQLPTLQQRAEQTAEHAPPDTVWPLIRRQHADLERDYDTARRGARDHDVNQAETRTRAARQRFEEIRGELAVTRQETERRADLPPDRRDIEQAARAEREQRERQAVEDDRLLARAPATATPRERRDPVRAAPAREPDLDRGVER